MRLLVSFGAGFGVSFGVGWLCSFSYQTDWIAGLILSVMIHLTIQIDELYMLVVESVPGAKEHARLPRWIKENL